MWDNHIGMRPHCKVGVLCGKESSVNLRKDENFSRTQTLFSLFQMMLRYQYELGFNGFDSKFSDVKFGMNVPRGEYKPS